MHVGNFPTPTREVVDRSLHCVLFDNASDPRVAQKPLTTPSRSSNGHNNLLCEWGYDFPDDFPQRLVRFQEESSLS